MPEAVLVAAVRTPVGRAPKGALSTTRPDDLAATALTGALDRVPALEKSDHRRRNPRLRAARGRAGLEHRPHGRSARRPSRRNPRRHRQPPLRLRPGGHRAGRSAHPLRRRARRRGRRRRIHEPHSHGRQQAQPQSLARRQLSRVAAHHGPHRRARRPPLRHLARRPGRLRPREPPESSRRASRRPLRRRTRSRHRHNRHAGNETGQARHPGKSISPPTKARAPTPPPKRSPSSSPPFTRRARSPPATPRKPPTAQPPPSSWKPAARASSAFSPSPASSPTPSPAACLKRWASVPSPPSPKLSRHAGLTLNDIELIELNEAFAAQVLAVIRALDLDPARVNVNGGAIALGHPLGCTGAKLTATLLARDEAAGMPATAWSPCASAAAWAPPASSSCTN